MVSSYDLEMGTVLLYLGRKFKIIQCHISRDAGDDDDDEDDDESKISQEEESKSKLSRRCPGAHDGGPRPS